MRGPYYDAERPFTESGDEREKLLPQHAVEVTSRGPILRERTALWKNKGGWGKGGDIWGAVQSKHFQEAGAKGKPYGKRPKV